MALSKRHKRIRVAMYNKDVTNADIAREVGKSRPLVSMVISGDRNSPEIRDAIARSVGQPESALFGAAA